MPELTDALQAHFAEIYADLRGLNATAESLKADLPVLIESIRSALPPIITNADGATDKAVRAAENIKWRGDDVSRAVDTLNGLLKRLEAVPAAIDQQNQAMQRAAADVRYESDRMFGLSRRWAFFGAFAGSFAAIAAAVAINYFSDGRVFSPAGPAQAAAIAPATAIAHAPGAPPRR